jgi:hypothetical protein
MVEAAMIALAVLIALALMRRLAFERRPRRRGPNG